jgi:hypothetical protein
MENCSGWGKPDTLKERSVASLAVVTTVATLLEKLKSISFPRTVAVFVMTLGEVGTAVTVTSATAPEARLPSAHVITPF